MDCSCKNCDYYQFSRQDEYAGEIGLCRYDPPVYENKAWNLWPNVKANAWCGKWRQTS